MKLQAGTDTRQNTIDRSLIEKPLKNNQLKLVTKKGYNKKLQAKVIPQIQIQIQKKI